MVRVIDVEERCTINSRGMFLISEKHAENSQGIFISIFRLRRHPPLPPPPPLPPLLLVSVPCSLSHLPSAWERINALSSTCSLAAQLLMGRRVEEMTQSFAIWPRRRMGRRRRALGKGLLSHLLSQSAASNCQESLNEGSWRGWW